MKIHRIVIRDFGKLRGETVIEGLGPGVTVIIGDNEEGKSTALKAVQAALFDRHTLMGERLDDMRPYGDEGVAPAVELYFALGGTDYHLAKTFRPRASAEIATSGQRIQGDAVEEKLANLLRFSHPGKGAAKAEHRGMWSLFWVEQGTAFEALNVNSDAKQTLEETLQGQVGKVLGGKRGATLVEAVRKRLGEHFTPQGRPKGPAKEMQLDIEGIDEGLRTARFELKKLEDQTRQLSEVEERIGRRDHENRAAQCADAVKAAKAKKTAIDALHRRVEKAQGDLKLAGRDADAAAERWQLRRASVAKLKNDQMALSSLEKEAAAKGDAYAAEEKRVEGAREHARTMVEALAAAQHVFENANRAVTRAELAATLTEIRKRLRRAEASHKTLTEAQAQAAAIGVDDDAKKKLERLANKASEARIRLESAVASVVFRPDAGQSVRRDGAKVAAGKPVHLSTAATFVLSAFGAVEIRPGGGAEISTLRGEVEKAERALSKSLAELEVPDVGAAVERHAQWAALVNTIGSERSKLDGIAPEGIEELRIESTNAEARLKALGGELDNAISIGELETARTAAETTRSACARNEKDGQGRLRTAEDALNDARNNRTEAETRLAGQQRSIETSQLELDAARIQASDEALERVTVSAQNEVIETQARCKDAKSEYERANPDAVALEQENAEQALNQINGEITRDAERRLQLRAGLNALGAQGFGEQVMQLEGDHARLAVALAAAKREADALDLLHKTLDTAQRTAREAFTEPVREKIRPYLRLLFPETEIGISEITFDIDHLRRNAVDEPFDALSIGTREQIAVLVRLAFAEYLADSGVPPVVILDDALVNADPERMRRMLLALRKASQRLQILVFTCHESAYAALGAPVIRLADCCMGHANAAD